MLATQRKPSPAITALSLSIALLLPFAIQASAATPGPGSPDPSFSSDGKYVADIGGRLSAGQDADIMPDGRILVVGETNAFAFVLRFHPNGELDKSFANKGRAKIDLLDDSERQRILWRPNGKIYVHATVYTPGNNGDFAMVKLNSKGVVDESFGTDGVQIVDTGGDDRARLIAPAPGGKFFAVGQVHDGSSALMVVRYNANGTLDTNTDGDPSEHWGEDGIVTADFGASSSGLGVQSLSSGKVMAAGVANDYEAAIVRFHPDGTYDDSFHDDGRVIHPMGSGIFHIEKMNFAGGTMYAAADVSNENGDFLRVARFTPDGDPDPTFGTNGRKVVDLPGTEYAEDVAIAADGKPTIAIDNPVNPNEGRWRLVRLKLNGDRDPKFGKNGVVTTRFRPQANDEHGGPAEVDIQADGRILSVGTSRRGEEIQDLALARHRSGTCGTIGTNDPDTLNGVPARDFICGLEGADTIKGRSGKDRLVGGRGNDSLDGGPGFDVCIGGKGSDTFKNCESIL